MREIKFRAWDGKRMNYDPSDEPGDLAVTLINNWFFEAQRDGLVVMQFAGILDKNGKEIYEGDIIKTEIGTVGDVQFSHGVFGVEWVMMKEDRGMVGSWGQLHNLRTLDDGKISEKSEVIGNIYENPELMKCTSTNS